MIFAKISPVATVVRQDGPFNTTSVTGSYMTAAARPYVLGADEVKFQVSYGEVVLDENGAVIDFKAITDAELNLSGAQIANWGTDDSVIFNQIATANGLTISKIVSGSVNNRLTRF